MTDQNENRIAVAREFGGPEVIRIEPHPVPALPSGGVLVAVRTAGLNPVDARRRAGGFGGRPPLVFGTEYAGTVLASDVAEWPVGADVIGWGVPGAQADIVSADPSMLVAKPEALDWVTAGGFGGAARTAVTALDALDLQQGDTVVVHGAAGGVGTILTQLALARGLRVIGTAGEDNQERLRALGAIPVVYGPGTPERIAAAADGQPLAASIDLAGTPDAGAVAASVRGAGGQAITLVPETAASHGIPLVRSNATAAQMRDLVASVVDGGLVVPVESLPFDEIQETHRRLDSKHARGKLVLDLSDNPHLAVDGSER